MPISFPSAKELRKHTIRHWQEFNLAGGHAEAEYLALARSFCDGQCPAGAEECIRTCDIKIDRFCEQTGRFAVLMPDRSLMLTFHLLHPVGSSGIPAERTHPYRWRRCRILEKSSLDTACCQRRHRCGVCGLLFSGPASLKYTPVSVATIHYRFCFGFFVYGLAGASLARDRGDDSPLPVSVPSRGCCACFRACRLRRRIYPLGNGCIAPRIALPSLNARTVRPRTEAYSSS
jgi:hypothetical protein